MTTDTHKEDELMKRLERLQKQAGATPPPTRERSAVEEAEYALTKAREASAMFNEVSGAWSAIKKPFLFAWGYIKPTYELGKYGAERTLNAVNTVLPWVSPVARTCWNGYRAVFNRVAYTRDEDGERTVLNKPRGRRRCRPVRDDGMDRRDARRAVCRAYVIRSGDDGHDDEVRAGNLHQRLQPRR